MQLADNSNRWAETTASRQGHMVVMSRTFKGLSVRNTVAQLGLNSNLRSDTAASILRNRVVTTGTSNRQSNVGENIAHLGYSATMRRFYDPFM